MSFAENWPPSHFAVLQNGDGLPPYMRPIETGETEEGFADRIGEIVARDIEYTGTAFVDVIQGATGVSDPAVSNLVLAAMAHHKAQRQAARESLTS